MQFDPVENNHPVRAREPAAESTVGEPHYCTALSTPSPTPALEPNESALLNKELLILEFKEAHGTALNHFENGRFTEVLAALQPWKKRLNGSSPDTLQCCADLFLCLGAAHERLGNPREAEICTGRALAISQKLERAGRRTHVQRAVLLMNLGCISNDIENFPAAITAFGQSRILFRALRPPPYSLMAQNELQRGLSYLGLSDETGLAISRAARAFSAAVSLVDARSRALSTGEKHIPEAVRSPIPQGYEGIACYKLGCIELARGHFRKSYFLFERAVRSSERELGDSSSAFVEQRQALGVASLYECKYQTTFTQAERLLASASHAGASETLVLLWGKALLGSALYAQGKLAEGREALKEARRLSLGMHEAQVDCVHKLLHAAAIGAKRHDRHRLAQRLIDILGQLDEEV
jgi:tetratricopeptide (TPR) repeat protein